MSKLISRCSATMAINTSGSSAINLEFLTPTILEMPASWTAACISFYASGDGTNYFNIFDEDGMEIAIPAAAGQRIFLPSRYFQYNKLLKIRSGTSANAVIQLAERIFYVELWE